ncbi:hypothetical protein ACQ4PT_016234 [Festuca glaucescens]
MAAGDHHLRLGSYLGDVSALSFLPSSPRPLLLAGTGSELLVYDVDAARLVASFKVFDGVRVHGIQPRGLPNCSSGSPPADGLTVAAFGERRAKLLRLRVDADDDGGVVGVRLELEQRLPGFDHWVLDACFLEVDGLLAIGLSDNSVALWDLTEHVFVTRVNSPEKCLLYSMRMWGDSVKSLLVASGTILNEILIWKLVPRTLSSSLLCTDEVEAPAVENRENVYFSDNRYMAVHIGRLKEHEGSIFRISWSSDGSKFMSVSDDRSARMWMLSCQPKNFTNQAANIDNVDIIPKLTLFGHSARIWDCYISDSIVITAGEDCTCCIWGMDGKLIKMFKEHIGRGLWRCLYDPSSLVLITAGFDSAIKVHHLCNSSFHDILEEKVVPDDLKYESEVFEISSPIVSGQYGPLDSKSEYVRCLHFVQENVLYVATNNGYLHLADLSDTNDVRWTEVIQVTEKAPIICVDVMTVHSDSLYKEDIVALGDGHGNVTIVHLSSGNLEPKVDLSFTWSAEKDRQLLGIYWCKSLECRYSASNAGRWCSSKMLGEHVGGSAVRDTCFITKTYTLLDKSCNSSGSSGNILVENEETTFLLISVGSKQVLTTWILQPRIAENRQVCSGGLDLDSKQSSECSDNGDSAVTFQWLSTHMPPKLTTNRRKTGHVKQNFEEGNSSAQPNLAIMDQMENDWRYLSVTAFLLKHPTTKLTVCFAVVACSDATVILRALLLPSRLWFDVALLVPQASASPVLVLRHIVDASSACSGDDVGNGDRYIIVSGSTDGTITLWDLTDTIHGFMQLVSETQPHMVIDCQKRPKTGRGSQGGRRRWRSLASNSVKKGSKQTLLPTENDLNASCVAAESSHEISELEENEVITTEDTMSSTHSCDVSEVQPMQTFSGVHQSGVNCLNVSEMDRACPTTGMSSYCIISGGDDQAVQCIVFTLGSPQQSCSMNKASLNSPANGALTILSQHAVPSAHGSAVKGIWTDGVWAFSSGLDQRIRCWKMDPSGKFMEHSHVIISVPEPETLDVYHDRGRGKYHIAVAGRGMQMVEFSPLEDDSMEVARI